MLGNKEETTLRKYLRVVTFMTVIFHLLIRNGWCLLNLEGTRFLFLFLCSCMQLLSLFPVNSYKLLRFCGDQMTGSIWSIITCTEILVVRFCVLGYAPKLCQKERGAYQIQAHLPIFIQVYIYIVGSLAVQFAFITWPQVLCTSLSLQELSFFFQLYNPTVVYFLQVPFNLLNLALYSASVSLQPLRNEKETIHIITFPVGSMALAMCWKSGLPQIRGMVAVPVEVSGAGWEWCVAMQD